MLNANRIWTLVTIILLVLSMLIILGCKEKNQQRLDAVYEGGESQSSKFRTICVEGYRYLVMEEDYYERSYGGLTQMWENTQYGPRPMLCRQHENTLSADSNPI